MDNIDGDIRALQLDSSAEDSNMVPDANDERPEESVVTDDVDEGKEDVTAAAAAPAPAPEVTEEVVEGNKKRHLNVVFIGHVGAGKSTIAGQILYLSGQVDERMIQEYEKEAKEDGRESCYMAYIMDTNEEERAKGQTVEVGRAHFETRTTRFTILDTPGHKSYVSSMVSGVSQADIGVLVLSARKGEFETGYERGGQNREHVLLAKALRVSKLLVVVNKMDDPTVNWSKKRYDEIESKMVSLLKSSYYNVKKRIQFLPISGLHGTNMQKRVEKSVCPWFNGQCLFDTLDVIEGPLRDPQGPFRMPIFDKFEDMGTVVMGKVESGSVQEGNSLLIMPNNVQVKVLAIYIDEDEDKVRSAGPGENLRVRVSGIEEKDILSGFVLSSFEIPITGVHEFVADLEILELLDNTIFTVGYRAVLHIHSVVEECEIIELMFPTLIRFAKEGQYLRCRIQVHNMICIEKYLNFKQLGRLILRTQGKTVAVGEVFELA